MGEIKYTLLIPSKDSLMYFIQHTGALVQVNTVPLIYTDMRNTHQLGFIVRNTQRNSEHSGENATLWLCAGENRIVWISHL